MRSRVLRSATGFSPPPDGGQLRTTNCTAATTRSRAQPTVRAALRAGGGPAHWSGCGRGVKERAAVPHALPTVDIATGEAAPAHHQRSDVGAVPAAGVVAEAMVALVLANAMLEKFGGDSVAETRRNLEGYLAAIPPGMRTEGAREDAAGNPTHRMR